MSARNPTVPPSPAATWRIWQALESSEQWQSVSELRNCCDLSRPTVLAGLGVLREAGWLESQLLPSPLRSGGRPAEAFRPYGNAAHLLAARISRNTITVAVINSVGTELTRKKTEIPDPVDVVPTFIKTAHAVIKETQVQEFAAGVVATIGICRGGQVITSHLFPTLQGERLRQWCSNQLGIELAFENDAKMSGTTQLASLASNDPGLIAVTVHLDEAPGCALIINGKLLDGAHGAAGELAFGPGLGWGEAQLHLAAAAASHNLTPNEVFELSNTGHPWAGKVMTELADRLTHGILGLLLALDPHVLSFGGPGAALDSPLVKTLVTNLHSLVPSMPQIALLIDHECVLNGAKNQARIRLLELRRKQLFRSETG